MNKLKKLFLSYLFKKEIGFDILSCIILALMNYFLMCLTYDKSKLDSLSLEDSYTYSILGLNGITIQSYFFPFIVLIFVVLFTEILYSFLSLSAIQENYFLLKIKGYKNINRTISLFHLLKNIFVCSFALLIYTILYVILNSIFKTAIPIFTFSVSTIYLAFAYLLYSQFVYLILLKLKSKPRQFLKFLRKKY